MLKRVVDGHGDSYSLPEFREAVLSAMVDNGNIKDGRGGFLFGPALWAECRYVVRECRGYIRRAWEAGSCPHAVALGAWNGLRTERDYLRELARFHTEGGAFASCTIQ